MNKLNLKKLLKKIVNRKQRRTLIFFLVKLGFNTIDVSDKIIKARRVVAYTTGNAYFTTPSPTLESVTTLADTLEAAEAAMDGSRLKTETRDTALAALTTAMKGLQSYVENVAAGNVEKILSSGFDVRNPRTNSTVLPAPIGLKASNTQIIGQIKLKWKATPKKLLYVVEMCQDGAIEAWNIIGESSKASLTINNQVPGVKYRFRVAVINSAGPSGFSDEASCRPN